MVLHLGQLKMANIFGQYDYGSEKLNIERYGVKNPPKIDLSKISKNVPISMYVCREDTQATPTDAIRAMGEIGESVVSYREIENCDHCAFNIGANP